MDYSRQIETFDKSTFTTPIHIIGCGATGSWIALNLVKLGIGNLHLWDFDHIEEHNIPNQAFPIKSVGEPKAYALEAMLCYFASEKLSITVHNERVNGEQNISGIVIVATDTMKSRKEIYEKAVKNRFKVKLLIEPRMAKDGGFIYIVDGKDGFHQEQYEKTLYSDDVAEVSACGTSQSVVSTAMVLSSMIAWQLINLHNGLDMPNCITIATEYPAMFTDTWKIDTDEMD